jgi:UDP-3-O-acyl-N-acetylglucosamine deacetylase
MEKHQQIVKCLPLNGIEFQYNINIQNNLIQDQSIFTKVNVGFQLKRKRWKKWVKCFFDRFRTLSIEYELNWLK